MKNSIPGGLLIVIEGIDGAGKTTLAQSLATDLRESFVAAVTGKEPTQGPFGQELRQRSAHGRLDPTTELELLLRDREQHVRDVIAPSLAAEKVVILDRYYFSNMAYQGVAGLDESAIRSVNEAIAPPADAVLLLDLDPDTALGRISGRGDLANHFEKADTLAACRARFLSMSMPGKLVIDAALPAAEVHARALRHVLAIAGEKIRMRYGLTAEGIAAAGSLFRLAPA